MSEKLTNWSIIRWASKAGENSINIDKQGSESAYMQINVSGAIGKYRLLDDVDELEGLKFSVAMTSLPVALVCPVLEDRFLSCIAFVILAMYKILTTA